MRSLLPFSWMVPGIARKDEADPFSNLRREIDRLFEDFGRTPAFGFAGGTSPRVNVSETDTALEIEAELPGLDEKDVEVVLRDDVLVIRGEKKAEREEKKKDYHVVERSFGQFSRAIPLPFAAEGSAVRAEFSKGVLKVTIAKPAGLKDKTVKIPVVRT
jgi:HSP20 family protein